MLGILCYIVPVVCNSVAPPSISAHEIRWNEMFLFDSMSISRCVCTAVNWGKKTVALYRGLTVIDYKTSTSDTGTAELTCSIYDSLQCYGDPCSGSPLPGQESGRGTAASGGPAAPPGGSWICRHTVPCGARRGAGVRTQDHSDGSVSLGFYRKT